MSGITTEEIPQLCDRLERAVEEVMKRKTKTTVGCDIEFTDWRVERPFLDLNFVSEFEEKGEQEGDDYSTENSLMESLLTSFLGGQTEKLIIQNEQSNFEDDERNEGFTMDTRHIDSIEAGFATKCVSISKYYSVLAKFIEDNYFISVGRVNEAFAASIYDFLNDYRSFIVAAEKSHRENKLLLHDLWYSSQGLIEILKLLVTLVNIIKQNDSHGAKTLSLLHDYILTLPVPNEQKRICYDLTADAAVPFMESIQKWVFNGEIDDPYNEFMVIEHFSSSSKDQWKRMEEYWEKKYKIRKTHVPTFLESLEPKILNAGKYLNVIKECISSDRDFKLAPIEKIVYDKETSYAEVINKAYRYSSKQLLNYMLNEYNVKERIMSLKRYFLLEQGDFLVQLLDTCNDELIKETSEILPSRLNTLVEMAIRVPSSNDDPYRDEIRMSLQKRTLSEQVHKIFGERSDNITNDSDAQSSNLRFDTIGYESFSLSINCEWPVSLVLHSKIISLYQMLFRHLFYCKYVENILSRVWTLSQPLRSLPFKEARSYAKTNALSHKMMIFVQHVEYYMMEVVIESYWMEFMQNFYSIPNVDELINEHWKFLDLSMKDCMLGDVYLFGIFRQILSDCLEFGTFVIAIKSLTETNKYPTFLKRIDQLDEVFEENLNKFYFALQEATIHDTSSKLSHLFNMIKDSFVKKTEEI